MSKQALGKGFDGLIPTGFDVATVAEAGEVIKQLSRKDIVANPDQPRSTFDEEALNELASSIKQHGIIQPLVVTPIDGGKYRIVAGERRYRAAGIAGLEKLPCVIRNHKELEELEIALVENVQRVDLSPLETAVSIVRLRDQFSLTPKQIAQKLGKAETTISNTIRLLQLPKEAVTALQNGSISEGHARAILSLKTDEKAQKELLNTIITQNLSVRDAEEHVKKYKLSLKQSSAISAADAKLIRKAETRFGVTATIRSRKKGGVLNISYSDDEQLASILKQLSS